MHPSFGLALLAVMRDELGSLDRVKRVVKVLGMVNAVPGFKDQPKVINGCSDLFVEVFGERIGVAFQLVDDVIDLSGAVEKTGKAAGTDLRAGVPTLPVLYLRKRAALDADSAALLERLERAIEASTDDDIDADFAPAVAELRAHSVTDDTIAEAQRWADRAVDGLQPLPDGPVKKALTRFAQAIVERSG